MRKSLRVRDVFSIATGAMIGSGFFLLPGIAFAAAGPAVILAYLLAAVLIVPTLLSNAELATAMPRAGGTYFFASRSMGPMAGVIDGLAGWMAMLGKTAFALVGIGFYVLMATCGENAGTPESGSAHSGVCSLSESRTASKFSACAPMKASSISCSSISTCCRALITATLAPGFSAK